MWEFLLFHIPTFIWCCGNSDHSNRCAAVSLYCFNLYFPDDTWCGASLHMLIGHLCIFFGEVSLRLCLLFNWVFFYFLLSFRSYLNFFFFREHASQGEGQRETKRKSEAGFSLRMEPSVRFSPMMLRSWPEPKLRVGHSTNWATQMPQKFLVFFR